MRRLLLLVTVFTAAVLVVSAVIIGLLYRTTISQEASRLSEVANNQARIIEAIARHETKYSYLLPADSDHGDALAATLAQLRAADKSFTGFGSTGEFTLARRDGDSIVFLMSHRHSGPGERVVVPFNARPGEPMRLALSGLAGTVIGPDYRGITVLAAYEPVNEFGLGVVAKLELAEVQAPFVRAGLISIGAALVVVLLGSLLFYRITNPVLVRLQEREVRLKSAQALAHVGSWSLDTVKNKLTWSDETYRIFGLQPQEFRATYEAFLAAVHPDDRAAVDSAYSGSVRENREGYEIEHRLVRRNTGEVRIVREKCAHIRNAAGRIIGSTGMVHDITERKRAEQALRESEDRLRKLYAAMCEGLALHQLVYGDSGRASDYRILDVNPRYEVLTGISRNQAVGRLASELYGTGSPPYVETYAKVAETGEPVEFETDFAPMAKSFHISVFSPGKGVFATVFTDITTRKLTEREMNRRAELDALLLELHTRAETASERELYDFVIDSAVRISGSVIGFLHGIADDEKTVALTTWNRRALETCTAPHDTHYPADKAGNWLDCLRQRRPVIYNDYATSPNQKGLPEGHTPLRRFLSVPIIGEGKVRIVFGVGNKTEEYTEQDATELQLAGNELYRIIMRRRAEERLRDWAQAFENAGWGVAVSSAEGRLIELVNPEFARMHGYTVDELAGAPIAKVVAPESRAELSEQLRLADERGHHTFESKHVRRDDSTFPALVDVTAVKGPAGVALQQVINVQDVTERKRTEEQLRAAMAELRRSNEELEQFAHVASHDLQQPLRMVASYVELLSQRYKGRLDDKADRYIAYASGGAIRMHQLVNDLLTFSRVGTVTAPYASVSLDHVVALARNNLTVAIEQSGATVEVERLPVVSGDETQLVQLFQNLLDNALKFRGAAAPRISVTCRDAGSEWELAVRDNGIGIDPKHAERIFGVFKRLHTEQEYPGTGIGLALCRKIVERHGGRIHVEPGAGGGSTFRFTLPKRPPATLAEPAGTAVEEE